MKTNNTNKKVIARIGRGHKAHGNGNRLFAEDMYKDGFRLAVDAKNIIDKMAMSHSVGGHRLVGTKKLEKCVNLMVSTFAAARMLGQFERRSASKKD